MSILQCAKNLGIRHNVSFRVIDTITGKVVSEHRGHNAATNSMLTGIAHYLTGDGVLNQGYDMLSAYIPKYISLGTMGLVDQEADENGLPTGIGATRTSRDADGNEVELSEEERFVDYITQVPGYGADGYDTNSNNNRLYDGLGPVFADRPYQGQTVDGITYPNSTVSCELISATFPRARISYKEIIPETESELPRTIDVVFSALISTGALAQFREPGKDYVFITEAGLWSRPTWVDGGDNGLLAGYRIAPPDEANWEMAYKVDPTTGAVLVSEAQAAANRKILKESILRVGKNQVVQVIWKIQLGSIDQLVNISNYYPEEYNGLYWEFWDQERYTNE